MSTLCVILDDAPISETAAKRLAARRPLRVLDLTFAHNPDDSVRRAIAGAESLDVRSRYDAILPDARARFGRFVARFPDSYRIHGRTFKQWLKRRDVSYWWFLELSQKNPESSGVFNAYCVARILRRELETAEVERVVAIGRGADEIEVLRRVCEAEDCDFIGLGVTRDWKATPIGVLARRLWHMTLALARRIIARRHAGRQDALKGGAVAFHTWFPAQWTLWNGELRDRYFVDVPDALDEIGAEVVYAASLLGESPARLLREAATRSDGLPALPPRALWIEAGVSLARLVSIYLGIGLWLRFLFRSSIDRGLEATIVRELDVDLSPVVIHDLRISIGLQLPHLLLLAEQMKAFVSRYRPVALVTVLELYCYGRAVAWGSRRGGNPVVFGLQHSPANANQMFYQYEPEEIAGPDEMPTPDHLILHGELTSRLLRRAGFNPERLHRLGAPRFAGLDALREARSRRTRPGSRAPRTEEEKVGVLVACVLWRRQTERLLRWCFEAVAGRDSLLLLIKPHPVDPEIGDLLSALSSSFPRVRHELVQRPLTDLLRDAAVMVTGNTSSDVEALAIGCPVIKLSTAALGSSPLDDRPGAVPQVGSAAELRVALAHVEGSSVDAAAIDAAIGPVDPSASTRAAELIWKCAHP